MISRILLILFLSCLLNACAPQVQTIPSPTSINDTSVWTGNLASPSPLPPATAVISGTSAPEYKDRLLCFAVEVPDGWIVDGSPSGFAAFSPKQGGYEFRVVNVSVGERPTLKAALDDVRRGPLGSYVQSSQNWTVDNQPALLVSYVPGAEHQFDVLVITPPCDGWRRSLFISATGADRATFELFLRRVHLLQSP